MQLSALERRLHDRLHEGLEARRLAEPLDVSRAVEGLGDHVDAVVLTAALEHGRHVPDAMALPAG
eukprot:2802628-Prymnesium_polylepis.1